MADGQPMPDDVFDGVDAEITIDALVEFTGPVSSFGCPGKQITIEHRLDLYVPDQQFDGFTRGQVLDAKRHDAVDDPSFEPEGPAMEDKFQGNENNAKKKVGDREERADESIIPARLFFIEYCIDVVGDVREVLGHAR